MNMPLQEDQFLYQTESVPAPVLRPTRETMLSMCEDELAKELQESFPIYDASPRRYPRWQFQCFVDPSRHPDRDCLHSGCPPSPGPIVFAILGSSSHRQELIADPGLLGRYCPTLGRTKHYRQAKEEHVRRAQGK